MLGMFFQQPRDQFQQVAMSTTPPLAGQSAFGQVMQEYMKMFPQPERKEGERKAQDIFVDQMRQNTLQNMIMNDPRVLEEQSRVYEGTMNRLADAANERAMKGHIFAGLLNPNRWQDAMSEKYRFSGPIVEMIGQAAQRTTSNPFVTRQYVNL